MMVLRMWVAFEISSSERPLSLRSRRIRLPLTSPSIGEMGPRESTMSPSEEASGALEMRLTCPTVSPGPGPAGRGRFSETSGSAGRGGTDLRKNGSSSTSTTGLRKRTLGEGFLRLSVLWPWASS
jgi:hypothetical protein